VLTAAVLMVAAHVGFRAWALGGGWFYVDDYKLLDEAVRQGLSVEYLLTPYDYQFMPFGRFVAWVVASSGPLDWTMAVLLLLLLLTGAAAACVWMLFTLFGARWGVLPPLALYLSSAMTLPASMWWAAALNQVPLQIVFFASVALWVRYLRRPSVGRALLVGLILLLGLLAYVKTVLLLPLLLAIQLFWFTSGSPRARLRLLAGKRGWGVGLLAVLGGSYVVLYLTQVAQPLEGSAWREAADIADTMVVRAFGTGVVGGPWRWASLIPPTSLADPPLWSVALAWTVIVAVVALSVITRRYAWPAWILLGGYLAAAWFLLISTRGLAVGALAGLEYRYLTDVGAAVCLCLGLAFLPVVGSSSSSERREKPLLLHSWGTASSRRLLGRAVLACALLVALLGGVVSSVKYARVWHSDHPAAAYLGQADADLAAKNRLIPLAEDTVPRRVMPPWLYPHNTTGRLLPLLGRPVAFPQVTAELYALDRDGALWQALVEPDLRSRPGPVEGCGWLVDAGGATIPIEGQVIGLSWWMRVAYAASAATPVVVTAGDQRFTTTLEPGPQSLYIRTSTPYEEVRIDGLAPGATVCVDVIEIGEAVPGVLR
jgi:hypothetical protein